MISLTNDQKKAVEFNGNIYLSACPGSGKTRVIIAKLLKLAEEIQNSPRSIGCITYTNAAVEEIELRIRQLGTNTILERCEISTIHSFCLQFILKPYSWLLNEIPKNFKIISREMPEFERIVRAVEDEAGRRIEFRTEFRTFDDYGSLRMNINGEPAGVGIENGVVTQSSALRFWSLIKQSGYLDFSMILYYSYIILNNYRFIGEGLSSRFAWLLIDEFQDTTDLQIEIFRIINSFTKTGFFLVGDEFQSINSFAGARPDLAKEFANSIEAAQHLSLTGNFRSGEHIILPAQTLIARNPVMYAAGKNKGFSGVAQYIHETTAVEAITSSFIPLLKEHNLDFGRCAILAPWWQHLIPIARSLRNLGIPVFGPGARPYQRSRLYATLAEQLGSCADSNTAINITGVEKAIFRIISQSMGNTVFDIFSYRGRCTALKLIYQAKHLAESQLSGVDWLQQSAQVSSEILLSDGWIDQLTANAIVGSVQEMINDMNIRHVDLDNLVVSDLGIFANPNDAIKLLTIHNSKGREFDAVAIVHANEGQIPYFMDRTLDQFNEAKRLFYVGITRAQKHLIVVSDQSDSRNRPTRFISESGF